MTGYRMDPKLGWSLDVLSFSLCSIFVLAFPLDRDNCGLEILKVGGCLSASTRGYVYRLEMVSSGFISPLLGISVKVIPIGSWEPRTSQVSGTF